MYEMARARAQKGVCVCMVVVGGGRERCQSNTYTLTVQERLLHGSCAWHTPPLPSSRPGAPHPPLLPVLPTALCLAAAAASPAAAAATAAAAVVRAAAVCRTLLTVQMCTPPFRPFVNVPSPRPPA